MFCFETVSIHAYVASCFVDRSKIRYEPSRKCLIFGEKSKGDEKRALSSERYHLSPLKSVVWVMQDYKSI